MHLQITSQYQAPESFVHKLDPRTKILSTLAFLLALGLSQPGGFISYLCFYLLLVVTSHVSGFGFRRMLGRSFIAVPFALAAVTLPFTVSGEPLVTIPVFGGLTLSVEGTVRFVSIVLKSWISVQAAILLVAITPFSDLLWGLRALHVPGIFVAIIGFAYRYLFVLGDEAARLVRARKARSGSIEDQRSGGTVIWRGKVTGHMAGTLLLRTMERSERIYQAMVARGYNGAIKNLSNPRMHKTDFLALATVIILVSSFLLLSYPLNTGV